MQLQCQVFAVTYLKKKNKKSLSLVKVSTEEKLKGDIWQSVVAPRKTQTIVWEGQGQGRKGKAADPCAEGRFGFI